MSEAAYLDTQSASFKESHPADGGWKVYVCFRGLEAELSLPYLLDFIRDKHPTIIKHRRVVNEVRTADMLEDATDSHSVVPGSDWDLVKELDANHWRGEIELEWQGQPIHYRAMTLYRNGLYTQATLVATKSNAILRDFHRQLQAYGKHRSRRPLGYMTVVNGEDFTVPTLSWDDVILPAGLGEEIRRNVEGFFLARETYTRLGLPYRRGCLFAGAPGCGKTQTIKVLASTLPVTFVTVDLFHNVDDDVMKSAFDMANRRAPAVLLLEDLDRLVKSKDISIAYFLNLLDGLKTNNGVLVLATSNHPEELDPALLHRPSRFDRVWHFALPNLEQRLALLRRKGGEFFTAETLEEAAERSKGFSMAYVQEIVVNALLTTAHQGQVPRADDLLNSFERLTVQRKAASKPEEDMAARESLGFGVWEEHVHAK